MFGFFVIHSFKCAGSTIYHQLPPEYIKRFKGLMSFKEYEKRNGVVLNEAAKRKLRGNDNKPICIDHIHIDEQADLGILDENALNELECIFIVREPTERFVSICNYYSLSPTKLCKRLRNKTIAFNDMQRHFGTMHNLFQHSCITTRRNWKVSMFRLEDKEGIAAWFSKFGVEMNMDKHCNVSGKKWSVQDLTDDQRQYITNYFAKDYELYEAVQ